MVNFNLTPEDAQVHQRARAFAQEILTKNVAAYVDLPTQRERLAALKPSYTEAVRRGLLKTYIPKPVGGNGTMFHGALQLEKTNTVDHNAALTLAATGLGLSPLFAGATPEQFKVLQPFLKEEGVPIASLVFSEPDGVANWLQKGGKGLQTTARREGDEYIVNGRNILGIQQLRLGRQGRGSPMPRGSRSFFRRRSPRPVFQSSRQHPSPPYSGYHCCYPTRCLPRFRAHRPPGPHRHVRSFGVLP
jgi:hypothetical protein